MIWHRYRGGVLGFSFLHDDMAASLPHLGKPMAREYLADLVA